MNWWAVLTFTTVAIVLCIAVDVSVHAALSRSGRATIEVITENLPTEPPAPRLVGSDEEDDDGEPQQPSRRAA